MCCEGGALPFLGDMKKRKMGKSAKRMGAVVTSIAHQGTKSKKLYSTIFRSFCGHGNGAKDSPVDIAFK